MDGGNIRSIGRRQLAGRWEAAIVIVAVVVLHARTLGHGFFLDDYALLRPWGFREAVGTLWGEFDTAGFTDAYFRPLASMSFGLEWPVWGTTKWGYHLTNLALHIGASLGVLAVLRRVRVPGWCALVGALYFAAVPSNVATVVYVAERTDAMVAICALVALGLVHRYHRTRATSSLVLINVCLVVAVLAKEIGVALVPIVAVYWWYLRVDAADPEDGGSTGWSDGVRSVGSYWAGGVRRYASALTERSGRRDWVRLLGPMAALTVIYVVYRQAVLPPGSLDDRFAETNNPLSALVGGMNSTFKGVPWEVRAWSYGPLIGLVVLAIAVRPTSARWRVVLLGVGLMVSGVLPLTFSGGVEPRLLYVPEIGMATVIAGLAAVVAEAVAVAGRDSRTKTVLTGVVAVATVAVVATTLVGMVQAQNQFKEGSVKKLDADLRMYNEPFLRDYVEPAHLAAIEARLKAAGRIP